MQKHLQDRLNALVRNRQNPAQPRNLVTRSGARVRGHHHSLRFPGQLSWETPEERTLIEVLDASPATPALLSQPARLSIPSEFGPFDYTPDVAVLRADGSVWVIECKPLALLQDLETQARHAAISLYLESFDVRFLELPNEAQPCAAVRHNLGLFPATVGKPVQYPANQRKEDLLRIAAQRPTTFRQPLCPRRRPVRSGCPGPRTLPKPAAR